MIFTPAGTVDSPELSSREGWLIFIQETYLEHPWVRKLLYTTGSAGTQPGGERSRPVTITMQYAAGVGEVWGLFIGRKVTIRVCPYTEAIVKPPHLQIVAVGLPSQLNWDNVHRIGVIC